jgi:5-methylthioadenosine/S-adenosylhomocysteine deaminase
VPGAKADLVVVDLDHPGMRPVRDPLPSLLHGVAERAVREVYLDGEAVVRDGRVAHLDYEGASRELQVAFERAAARVPGLDPRGRDLDTLAPLALPVLS